MRQSNTRKANVFQGSVELVFIIVAHAAAATTGEAFSIIAHRLVL